MGNPPAILFKRVVGAPLSGVPLPDDLGEEPGLHNPAALREALGAQTVARRLLPCIDTRAGYWRYYLLFCPGPGRRPKLSNHLFEVLEQTADTAGRRGIGRRIWSGHRTARMARILQDAYWRAYGTVTNVFWRIETTENDPGEPSERLRLAAREYVKQQDYVDFFDDDSPSGHLRLMFNARLRAFRPSLAHWLESHGFKSEDAATEAARSRVLHEEDKRLFLAWSLLRAYYGLPEDSDEDLEEEENHAGTAELGADLTDDDLRPVASAAVELLERVPDSGLSENQLRTLKRQLNAAIRHAGPYQPPVRVAPTDHYGRKRRIFASLRLRTFASLLRSTA